MGKIMDRITGRQSEPRLYVPGAAEHREEREKRAKECSGVLIDAYFNGVDPINGNELSLELRDAIAPLAIQRFMDEISERTAEATNMDYLKGGK
jgi:hypothetical protein